MSNFKWYKFDKLYKMSSGISSKPAQAGHGLPFVSFSTVFNNYFLPDSLNDLMDTSEREQEIYSVKEGDILLTRTSETIDELAMSSVAVKDYPNATFSGFVKRLRPLQNNVTYHKYLGFYLRSKFFRKTITNNAFMTLRASFNEEIFSYLYLYLPEYEIQKRIGDLLYLLSSKIELNNCMNAELESMARLLYHYWFVQFDFPNSKGNPYKSSGGRMIYNKQLKREVPEGWEVYELVDILRCNYDSIKKENGYKLINYLDTSNLTDNVIGDIQTINLKNEGRPSRAQRIVKRNDILYSTVRPNQHHFGIIKEPIENLIASTGFAQLTSKDEAVKNELIYLYLTSETCINRLQQIAESSVSAYPSISPDDLLRLKIALPKDEKILRTICSVLEPLFEKQTINQKQNKSLVEFRDWLLPMLMNGQVTVNEREIETV